MTDQSTSAPEYKEAPIDQLTRKTAQLYAMLATTYGGGFDAFNAWSNSIKNDYLWACADLAKEINVLSEHVGNGGMPS